MSPHCVFDALLAGGKALSCKDKAAEMMLPRRRLAKSPPRPVKPGDASEKEGLAALYYIRQARLQLFLTIRGIQAVSGTM